MGKISDRKIFILCMFAIAMIFTIYVRFPSCADLIVKRLCNEVIPMAYYDHRYEERVLMEAVPIYNSYEDMGADGYGNVIYLQEISDVKPVISDGVQEASTLEPEQATDSDAVSDKEVNGKAQDDVAVAVYSSESGMESIKYTSEQLSDFEFLVSNCYTIAGSTSINSAELDASRLLDMDMSIDASSEDYKILIYHTHGSEAFCDSRAGVTEDTIVGVGAVLADILNEKYNIKTYHDTTAYDMSGGTLNRSTAYEYSGKAVDDILKKYPSIEVIIDLHRDGVRDGVFLTRVVNGKATAQIMFLNGVSRLKLNGDIDYLYNPNKQANLAFSLQLHLAGKELYGDLFRRNYISGYCFNLDRLPRSSLIEVGAQTNTVEEAKNAMEPLAAVLYKVLKEK